VVQVVAHRRKKKKITHCNYSGSL